jgi:ElaB/YqjD/DUF883 family membrane-anchored ribosome-binding protein
MARNLLYPLTGQQFKPTGAKQMEAKNTTANSRTQGSEAKVTENVAKAAHSAVDRAADSAAKAEDKVRRMAASGEEQIKEKTAEARATAEQSIDQFRQYTRDNPLMSAGIAFAAGLLLSRLLSR